MLRLNQTPSSVEVMLYVVWGLIAFVLLYYALYGLGRDRYINIDHVQIETTAPSSRLDINKQEVAQQIRGHFFNIDVAALAQYIKSLPWIETVSVRRIFPNRVKIVVTEYQVLARWGEERFLSDKGDVFMLPPKTKELILKTMDLPQFVAPDGRALEVLRRYTIWRQSLTEKGWAIVRLELSERLMWQFYMRLVPPSTQLKETPVFQNNQKTMHLVLGRDGFLPTLEERLERLLQELPAVLQNFPMVKNVDLRYADGVALQ